ncbi:hypothetical protein KPNJ1_00621 [Klebsiella pneumoniae 30660/NJST258_1]|uniref:Uncharacterized protein n=1 Tax=Klebsiella pneumoniae 30684/NJST258_2 TaxID=1420013 RepID=W8UBZ1_KLEPN|nr:hypothetical protein KPNJ2_00659 [Klebsiella pneumoniae 30684/NJST258_2]AHM83027.1 hypothetical protein KPNJ1_00621 [Klebsiella pneumoniae 30660/NJST258_1]
MAKAIRVINFIFFPEVKVAEIADYYFPGRSE